MAVDDVLKITEWMKNQTVFITGVSGFIGKVLLWKLLKSCPDIKEVYVLLRQKKGKTTEERLGDLLSNEIFEEFNKTDPEILQKVKGIEGDICQERLGIQNSDWQLLQENVTLVFNVAASVRFDDSLKKATFTNLRSTKYAILLAKGMKNLKAFVHVSTAYTNCRFSHVTEKIIQTDFDPEKMIKVAEKFDEYKLDVLSQIMLKEYQNTYIFTKGLAEDLVFRNRKEIPVVIVRPAIVVSSVKEPQPGWCDSFSSITALLAATGKGVMRVNFATLDNDLDYTAVDTCVNAIIVSAWYRDVCFHTTKEEFVFNVTDFKYSLGFLREELKKFHYVYPLRNTLWRPMALFTTNILYYYVLTFLLHVLPGFIIDEALRISGKQPMLMRIYRKIHVAWMNLKPFVFKTFEFDTDNFKMLGTLVPIEEKESFFTNSFSETTIDKYLVDSVIGGRKLFGDPPEIFKEDIDRAYRLYWIHLICKIVLVGILIWILPLKSTFEWGVDRVRGFQDALMAIPEE